ncbi:hypothetical protein UB37_13590 [Photobacterium iliopiscarium]|jgi:hypothetical protein|uniref:Uncharacterized protein n=1 Tax=Photobacterium iliopiscarium TaxID=56192 RepID=A0A0D8PTY5_9GAMM|nr:hypothetical protein [Photobacterium iliopiscarium]KJG12402.1 hypothetical protein UB38_15460 [Photobacterium iliopiscarium]KJG20629.1 hypothetical protein UB37_13590 [Photobacterium iliopiscarium]MCD9468226.1 hypothetical protein [Photobacterium iliopiscarium]MCD9488166.1 hypothetical protein [Photobacterium iliopiscarium]MCF2244923.1 hypothetical protein [Photobacterium iliopiscarium]
MKSDSDKLIAKHEQLIHSEGLTVYSHTQRDDGEWIQHSLMIDGYNVPFKFKRKARYRTLTGAKVNMTYYVDSMIVAGLEFEIMKVVRIKRY